MLTLRGAARTPALRSCCSGMAIRKSILELIGDLRIGSYRDTFATERIRISPAIAPAYQRCLARRGVLRIRCAMSSMAAAA